MADLPADEGNAKLSADTGRRLTVMVEEISSSQVVTTMEQSDQLLRGFVRISIADDGPGIPDAVLPHLFEPFFTTKPTGEGLGLGLSISLTIVESLGGKISARNRSEGGAEFLLEIPAT